MEPLLRQHIMRQMAKHRIEGLDATAGLRSAHEAKGDAQDSLNALRKVVLRRWPQSLGKYAQRRERNERLRRQLDRGFAYFVSPMKSRLGLTHFRYTYSNNIVTNFSATLTACPLED